MNITISRDGFSNLAEVWEYGPNTIVVRTTDGRQVKITAAHNIKSGTNSKYCAEYEEIREIRIENATVEVWATANYRPIDGDTIGECLLCALEWVNAHKSET